MKRILVPGTLALALAAAVTPVAMTSAHAVDRPAPATAAALQSPAQQAALKADAQRATGDIAAALGLTSDDTFTVVDVVKDADGATHTRVDRTHKGIPVLGGDLVVHRDAAGAITGHSGMFAKKITVSLTPSFSATKAATKGLMAAKAATADEGLANADETATGLVVHVDEQGTQRLGYASQVTGLADDKKPSRIHTVIDAHTGATLSAYDEIVEVQGSGKGVFVGDVTLDTTRSGSGYELRSPSTGNWTTDAKNQKIDGTIMTDADNRWGNGSYTDRHSAGVDAQFGADKTYEFLRTVLGRNGIWNNGTGVRSRVHYDTNYTNAFWNGKEVTYGDGANDAKPLTELDVVAHEIAHGVNANSARLVYRGDAGGLNEANSDILGSAVEWYANLASDTPDYLIGEKVDLRGNGTPLRYFDKPSKDGKSPDCYSSSVGGLDPHYSGGPMMHWFYLASEGSGTKTINGQTYTSTTCNNSTVTGAGRENMEKVWYRALSTKFTSTTTYPAAREGLITSAIELYGASSPVCYSVQSALDAVNVPAGNVRCAGSPDSGPTPTPVPEGGALVNGGFEDGTKGWTGSTTAITNDAALPARSGSWKLAMGGQGKDATMTVDQTVAIPANGRLTFGLRVLTDEYTALFKNDTMKVQLVDPVTRATYVLGSYSNLDKGATYATKTLDLAAHAGKTMTVSFVSTENPSRKTTFLVDDVAVG